MTRGLGEREREREGWKEERERESLSKARRAGRGARTERQNDPQRLFSFQLRAPPRRVCRGNFLVWQVNGHCVRARMMRELLACGLGKKNSWKNPLLLRRWSIPSEIPSAFRKPTTSAKDQRLIVVTDCILSLSLHFFLDPPQPSSLPPRRMSGMPPPTTTRPERGGHPCPSGGGRNLLECANGCDASRRMLRS